MSTEWTVTQDKDGDLTTQGIADMINQVVEDDYEGAPAGGAVNSTTPSKPLGQAAGGSDTNLAGLSQTSGNEGSGSLFTKQQSAFSQNGNNGAAGPAGAARNGNLSLNPDALTGTPSKEGSGLDTFNNWVRQQGTPNSSRNSPTPNGSYYPQSNPSPHSLAGNGRTGGSMGASPLKPSGSPTNEGMYGQSSNHNQQQAGTLDAIQEQRRQLMMQMEELSMKEAEARNGSSTTNPYDPNYQSPNGQPQQQLTLDSVRGRIYETAKDQHGCRFLQRLLDQGQQESIEAAQVILSEILQNVPELMTDQYANFLVQKLFDMMPHDVRYTVAQVAAPHLCTISLTPHGTFSVQKLIETIATREEMEVVQSALKQDVVQLVKDVHGNHVIQKVLQRFEHQDTQFIYDSLTTDCVAIATNKQGCCVLQRCLEYASDAQRQQMVSAIVQSALTLVQDPFGNYVVQYVLDGKEVAVNDAIAELFLPHIVMLSTNKFSSNVVEKVVKGASMASKEKYVITLFDQNTLMRLLRDDYGNYVVQTALTEAPYHHAEQLVMCIRPIMHHIRNAPYAKKLEAKMDLVLKKKAGGFSPHRGPRHHHDHHHHHGGYGGGYGGPHGGHHHPNPHAMRGNPHMQEAPIQPNPYANSPTQMDQHRPFRATAAPWSPQLSMNDQM